MLLVIFVLYIILILSLKISILEWNPGTRLVEKPAPLGYVAPLRLCSSIVIHGTNCFHKS